MTSSAETTARSRTVVWDDPATSARAARVTPGRVFLEAIARGEVPPPPVAVLLGMGIEAIDEGRVSFTLDPAEFHYNPIGSVHGGVVSTLCDSAMGCAIQSTLPAGAGYTTVELKVSFLRALTVGSGLVRCEGRVIHVGGRIATAEARVTDAAGRLYAHATTTCMVFRPEKEV
ncbi:MAG TPA: PaaI family thioesterase [Chloroflexaceae bacterium]|nr:PaaI family thioesterase [Chloroflexaceae bacterium]